MYFRNATYEYEIQIYIRKKSCNRNNNKQANFFGDEIMQKESLWLRKYREA
jgi:hypothetical protein